MKNKNYCNQCGEPATIFGYDPYTEDIYPEDLEEIEEEWWCECCWDGRNDDI